MAFEVNTLFLLTIDVEAILGLLLLLVWVQNTRVQAVAWWATAHLMRAASVMLYGLYGSVPDLISIDLSNVILFSSFGVTWNGARVFNGRAALPGSLIAGAVLWLLASQWPGFEAGSEVRGQLSSMIIAGYTWLAAYEFWRGRKRAAGLALARDRAVRHARHDVPAAHAAQRAAARARRRQPFSRARGSACSASKPS